MRSERPSGTKIQPKIAKPAHTVRSAPRGPPKEALHPSWEAKRLAEQQRQAAFAGTKVKFDD